MALSISGNGGQAVPVQLLGTKKPAGKKYPILKHPYGK